MKSLALLLVLMSLNMSCTQKTSSLNDTTPLSPASDTSKRASQVQDEVVGHVKVLNDGIEAGQARIDLIQKAQNTIVAEYFIYAEDETSYVGLALLRAAARRGVRVRLIVDALFNGIPKELREYLQIEGIEIREYNPLNPLKLKHVTRRMHDKILIVDDNELITGGRNIENDYYDVPGPFQYRDRDVYTTGSKIVGSAVEYFEKMWENKQNVKPASFGIYKREVMFSSCSIFDYKRRENCKKRRELTQKKYYERLKELDEALYYLNGDHGFVLQSGRNWAAEALPVKQAKFISDPVGKKGLGFGVEDNIVSMINTAHHSLTIESPYVNPDKQELDAITAAVKRGVEVRILTNSSYSGDNAMSLVSYYKSEREEMMQAGAKIWEYKGPESLHAKAFVIDGRLTYIGSFNLDRLSYNYNTETGLVTDDEEIAQIVLEDIEERMSGAWEIGVDGKPIGMAPDLSYPWKEGKNNLFTKILRFLLPLYKSKI